MNPFGFLFVGMGLFSVVAALVDWDLFMSNRKAQLVVGLFGRQGARIFYGLLGSALAVLGVLIVSGIVRDTR